MGQSQINLDKLVYLDIEFISRKYEEIREVDPATKFVPQQGGHADVKAFFANAGVTTQESRTYSITSREMLSSVWGTLSEQYPEFSSFENYQGTRLHWVAGMLGIAEWKKRGSDESGFEYFELKVNGQRMAFLSQESYLSAGFAQVFGASIALKANISIPVRCLVRVMWLAEATHNYVACPYIIFEQ
ncbi:hypothetical protein QN399_23365 [Pseudomonas sp. 10C3]|uniref:hypothetical protein n=1 Tax=Pseudomonas sp. 10C3 TaxID=3118753 RepID=UPI002E81B3CE|nr:hypothetical protein [Pseudomonas sp. 10C3]MEE3509149.1 hypothetical protein [Pseudomonas sp. 10C3]